MLWKGLQDNLETVRPIWMICNFWMEDGTCSVPESIKHTPTSSKRKGSLKHASKLYFSLMPEAE